MNLNKEIEKKSAMPVCCGCNEHNCQSPKKEKKEEPIRVFCCPYCDYESGKKAIVGRHIDTSHCSEEVLKTNE